MNLREYLHLLDNKIYFVQSNLSFNSVITFVELYVFWENDPFHL
jgi:hypothetical protein